MSEGVVHDSEDVSAESREIQEFLDADDATSEGTNIPNDGIQVILCDCDGCVLHFSSSL